jgi:hypothetical protein
MTMQDLIREGYWPSNSIPTLPVTSGLEFYLDASVAASVDVANQLWKNLVSSPASGASQTDYDFQMGDDTTSGDSDEPLHVGTAGGGHPFAYWNMGGDDFFQVPSNTTFLTTLQDTGGIFTLIFVGSFVTDSDFQVLMATRNNDEGIAFTFDGNTNALRYDASAGGDGIAKTADTALVANTSAFYGLVYDETGSNDSFFYQNGEYNQVGGSNTFSGFYTNNTTTPERAATIGYKTNSVNPLNIGSQVSAAIAYNTALTKSEMDQIYRHFKAQGRV